MSGDNYIELSEESFNKLSDLFGAGLVSWTEQQLGSTVTKEILAYEAVYFYYFKGIK